MKPSSAPSKLAHPATVSLGIVLVFIIALAGSWQPATRILDARQQAQRAQNTASAQQVWGESHQGTLSNVTAPSRNATGAEVVNVNVNYTDDGETRVYPGYTVDYVPALTRNGARVLFWVDTHKEYRLTAMDTTWSGIYLAAPGSPTTDRPWIKAADDTTYYDGTDILMTILGYWVTTSTGLFALGTLVLITVAAFVVAAHIRRRAQRALDADDPELLTS